MISDALLAEVDALVAEERRQDAMHDALFRHHHRSLARVTLYRHGEIDLSYFAHRGLDGNVVLRKPLPLEVVDQFRALANSLERVKDRTAALERRMFDEAKLPVMERKKKNLAS